MQNALEYAASHGLWEHALFLLQRHFASDAALQQRVLMRFIEKQLAVEDPLRTYYELELAINPSISVSLNRCAISSHLFSIILLILYNICKFIQTHERRIFQYEYVSYISYLHFALHAFAATT